MKKHKKEISEKIKLLITFSVMSLMTLIPVLIMVNGILDYNRSKSTYDDLEYREYIFDHCKRIKEYEIGSQNLIYVQGQEKPLKINNLLSTNELEARLDTLKSGDKIYCYVSEKAGAYNVAEIGKNEPFISLEEYNQAYRKNGILTVVIMSIVATVFAVLSVVSLVMYRKTKSAERNQFQEKHDFQGEHEINEK